MHLTGSGQQLIPAAGEPGKGKSWPHESILFPEFFSHGRSGSTGSSASSRLMNHYNCAMHMHDGEPTRALGEDPDRWPFLARCGHQTPRELIRRVLG